MTSEANFAGHEDAGDSRGVPDPVMSFAVIEEGGAFSGGAMLDRPLVFGDEVPSIMIYHEQIGRFHTFFEGLRVRFETSQFQQSFELIRFPALTNARVEELLDLLGEESLVGAR